jgi:hypothetical protein
VKIFLSKPTAVNLLYKWTSLPRALNFVTLFQGKSNGSFFSKFNYKWFKFLGWLRQKESNVLDILEYFMSFPSSGHNSYRSLISNAISQRQILKVKSNLWKSGLFHRGPGLMWTLKNKHVNIFSCISPVFYGFFLSFFFYFDFLLYSKYYILYPSAHSRKWDSDNFIIFSK